MYGQHICFRIRNGSKYLELECPGSLFGQAGSVPGYVVDVDVRMSDGHYHYHYHYLYQDFVIVEVC